MSWAPAAAGVAVIDDVFAFLGLPITKADAGPLTKRGFDALVRSLVTAMQSSAAGPIKASVRAATDRLDRDWGRLTDEQRDQAIVDAAAAMQVASVRVATAAAAPIAQAVHTTIAATRQATASAHHLAIPDVFSAQDAKAIEHARSSAGFFMRATGGKILSGATDQTARGIVARALEEGWDHRDTAKEMELALAGTIAARSTAYFEMVASVAIARSRTYSQLQSFEAAGISTFLFQSVLDEVTSDICRFLHGRTFEVRAVLGRHEVVNAAAPGDVVELQPFARVGRRPDGSRVLFVDSGGARTELAQIVQSAVGQQNETGIFKATVSNARLQALGCCSPPLHPHCRSTIVPGSARVFSMPTSPPALDAPSAPPVAPIIPTRDPLEEGIHFRKLRSGLSTQDTERFLDRAGFAWVRDVLERFPISNLVLEPTMENLNGSYMLGGREVSVNFGRDSSTFGKPFTAGTSWSVSSGAETLDDAVMRTFMHELGHHLHQTDIRLTKDIDSIIGTAFASSSPVTEYAQANAQEYFAESFAAYVFERAILEAHDPVGFGMVEAVLEKRMFKIP